MPHLFPGILGLIILAYFALKTIEGGGDWLDFLNCTARYEAAKTDLDFKLMFGTVAVIVVGIVGFAVCNAQLQLPLRNYQADAQPLSIASTKVHSVSHKSGSTVSHKSGSTVSHKSGSMVSHKSGSTGPHRAGSSVAHKAGSATPTKSKLQGI